MLLLFQRRTSYPKSIILSTYVAFLNILLRAKAQQFRTKGGKPKIKQL